MQAICRQFRLAAGEVSESLARVKNGKITQASYIRIWPAAVTTFPIMVAHLMQTGILRSTYIHLKVNPYYPQ